MFMAVTAFAAGGCSRAFVLREGSSVLALGDKIKGLAIEKIIGLCQTGTHGGLLERQVKTHGLMTRVFDLEDQGGACAGSDAAPQYVYIVEILRRA